MMLPPRRRRPRPTVRARPPVELPPRRQLWTIRPDDWRYFVRGGAALALLVAGIVAAIRLVLGDPLNETVLITAIAITTFGVGRQWFGAVHIARYVDRLRAEHGVSNRPVSRRTLLTGTAVILVLALAVLTTVFLDGELTDPAALGRAAAIAILPAVVFTGLLYLLAVGNRRFVERSETDQILGRAGADATP